MLRGTESLLSPKYFFSINLERRMEQMSSLQVHLQIATIGTGDVPRPPFPMEECVCATDQESSPDNTHKTDQEVHGNKLTDKEKVCHEAHIEGNPAESGSVYPSTEKQDDEPEIHICSQQLAELVITFGESRGSQNQISSEGRKPTTGLGVNAAFPVEDFKGDFEECLKLDSKDDSSLELGNLNVYADLPVEGLAVLEECLNSSPIEGLDLDPGDSDEFQLSQIDFSQDSALRWLEATVAETKPAA